MTRYITGLFALNIHQDSDTCGDWHSNILDNLQFSETDDLFGCRHYDRLELPNGTVLENVWVANHYRALTDRFIKNLKTNPYLAVGEVEDFLDGNKDEFTEYLAHFNVRPLGDEANRTLIREIGKVNLQKLEKRD